MLDHYKYLNKWPFLYDEDKKNIEKIDITCVAPLNFEPQIICYSY